MTQGLWPDPFRKPLRWLMIASLVVTTALAFWLVVVGPVFGHETGMKEMLAPGADPVVRVTLLAALSSLVSTAVFLSDRKGHIESDPHGFFDIVSLVASRISMLATATIVIVMFYEVVSRYAFERPTLWANELSLWIAGFVFLLSGIYAMQQRSHIRIYIVYDHFPRWLRKSCDVLSVVLIWTFAFFLIWGGYNEAVVKFLRWETFGTAWDPPIPATIKPAILIVIVMVAIQALSNLVADWNKAPETHTPADDVDETEIAAIRKSIEG